MIPKNSVDVTLTPEVRCVLEERFNTGITAVIKARGALHIVIHSRVWKAIMSKKDLLNEIYQALVEESYLKP